MDVWLNAFLVTYTQQWVPSAVKDESKYKIAEAKPFSFYTMLKCEHYYPQTDFPQGASLVHWHMRDVRGHSELAFVTRAGLSNTNPFAPSLGLWVQQRYTRLSP